MLVSNVSRIVLFPYNPQIDWYDHGRKEMTFDILRRMGGDIVNRVYEAAADDHVLDFINYVARIRDLATSGVNLIEPIVVLTRTCPLASLILGTREQMVKKIPGLERALWVICVDPSIDVSFMKTAERFGSFDRFTPDDFPIWDSGAKGSFLIITPGSTNLEALAGRVDDCLGRIDPCKKSTSPKRTASKFLKPHAELVWGFLN